VELLGAIDEVIAEKALNCLYRLALLPLAHRCEKYLSKTLTNLHKNPKYYSFLFEMVDASYMNMNASWKVILSNEFTIPESMHSVVITPALADNNTNNSSSDNNFVLKNLYNDRRSIPEIISEEGKQLSIAQKCLLSWIIRFRRLLMSSEGKKKLLQLQLQMAFILLTHPEKTTLFKFFHDKLELIKDFVWMISSPPSEVSSASSVDDLIDCRILATQCLSAALETRNSSSPPFFMHFPWLLDDLGVSRGQYMGVVPCLIRYSVSKLIALKKKTELLTPEEGQTLSWIENVFFMISMIMSVTAALPALTDNGLVHSFLTILKTPCPKNNNNLQLQRQNESSLFVFIDTLCMDILLSAFRHYPTILIIFKENLGIETIIHRLTNEMSDYLNCSSVNSPSNNAGTKYLMKLSIQYFLMVLSTFIQECKSDFMTGDEQQFQEFYQNKGFITVMEDIFMKTELFSTEILSLTFTMLNDMINKDPSPPTILNYLITSTGVAEKALNSFGLGHKVASLEQELPVTVLSFISSISISKDGINLVTKSRMMHKLFAFYLNEQFYYPKSTDLMSLEISITLGKNLEQLIRHYPSYLPTVFDSISRFLNMLYENADNYVNRLESKKPLPAFASESGPSNFLNFNEDFGRFINSSIGLMSCLEQLLEKKNYIKEFLTRTNGFNILYKMKSLSLGPMRSFLVSLAANQAIIEDCQATNNSSTLQAGSLGFPTLDGIINRCFEKIIVYYDSKVVFDFSLGQVTDYLTKLEKLIPAYWIAKETATNPSLLKGEVSATDQENSRFLDKFLDGISNDPIESHLEPYQLPYTLQLFANVLKHFALMDYSLELLGMSFTASSRHGRNSTINTECIKKLASSAEIMDKLNLLMNKFYFPMQVELSRLFSVESNELEQNNGAKEAYAQPNYVLRIIQDNATVRDSSEDTGKRLFALPKGCAVIATERKPISSSVMMKYKMEDGWIPQFRGNNLSTLGLGSDAMLIVTDVMKKPDASPVSAEEKDSKNQLTVVSLRKSGVRAFQHFNRTVKQVIFTLLPKLLIVADTEQDFPLFTRRLDEGSVMHCVHGLIPFFTKSLHHIFPEFSTANEHSAITGSLRANMTIPAAEQAGELQEGKESSAEPIRKDGSFIETSFLVNYNEIPSLQTFPTERIYSHCQSIELSQPLLMDARQNAAGVIGMQEYNVLLLLRLFYENDLISRLITMTVEVFTCAFNPFLEFKKEHGKCLNAEWTSFPTDWHSYSDEECLKGEFTPPSNAEQWNAYRSLRGKFTERRKQAITSLPRIIDIWRQLFIAFSTPATAFEKSLFEASNHDHNYNPEVFKRYGFLFLIRSLTSFWFHPLLYSLPTAITRSLLELWNIITKSTQNLKAFPLKSIKAKKSEAKSASNRRPVDTSRREWLNPRNIFGMLREASAPDFQLSEDAVNALIEMGFQRQECVNAINTLRTNDVNQLVPALIESFGSFMTMPDAQPTSATASSANAAPAAANPPPPAPPGPSEPGASLPPLPPPPGPPAEPAESVAPAPVAPEDLLTPVPTNPPLDSPPQTQPKPTFHMESESEEEEEEEESNPSRVLLPTIILDSEENLNLEKEFVPLLREFLLKKTPSIYLNMITSTSSKVVPQLEAENSLFSSSTSSAPASKPGNREMFTMNVLTILLKFFDGSYQLSEGVIRAIILSWLYGKASEVLSTTSDKMDFSQLYGLVHSILIVLSCRITGGSTIKSGDNSSRNTDLNPNHHQSTELLSIIMRHDSTCRSFHDQLIGIMTKLSSELENQQPEEVFPLLTAGSLLLDSVYQPVLVDRDSLKVQLKDLEQLSQITAVDELELIGAPSRSIFKEEVAKFIQEKYLNTPAEPLVTEESKVENKEDEEEKEERDETKEENKDAIQEEKVQEIVSTPLAIEKQLTALPLLDSGLSSDQQEGCANMTVKLLSYTGNLFSKSEVATADNKRKDALHSDLVRASIQFVIHLESEERNRVCFAKSSLSTTILELLGSSKVEGMDQFSRTILQRQFEDEHYLQQIMTTTMKVTFDKLLSQQPLITSSRQSVSLNAFLEITSPLIYRHQISFLLTLVNHYSIVKENNQIYLSLKDAKNDGTTTADQHITTSSKPASAEDHSWRHDRQHLSHEIVSSICQRITSHLLSVDRLDQLPTPTKQQLNVLQSVGDHLVLLSDLIATLPICCFYASRHRIANNAVVHAISNQSLSKLSFVGFLFHRVLLLNFSPKAADKTANAEGRAEANLTLNELLDDCYYFLASMLFRPGEGRKLVLDEIYQILSFSSESIKAMTQQQSFLHFIHFLQRCLHPPVKWLNRESFIVSSKEIIHAFCEKNIYAKLLDVFNQIEIEEGISHKKALESMANFLDSFMRKASAFSIELLPEKKEVTSSSTSTAATKKKSTEQALSSSATVHSAEGQSHSMEDVEGEEDLGIAAFEDMSVQRREAAAEESSMGEYEEMSEAHGKY
jgi:hypothetical protein